MAGKNTVFSSPELRPRGSHHLVLPFRGKPVRATPGSSSNENKQAEEYLKAKSQRKRAHHGHGITIKPEDDILEPAERVTDNRISLFTRATTRAANAIKSSQERHFGHSNSNDLGQPVNKSDLNQGNLIDLGPVNNSNMNQGNLIDLGRPVNNSNMNQGNLIDLTLDSDEELDHNPQAALHGLAPPNRPVSHLSPPPDERPPIRGAFLFPAGQLGQENAPGGLGFHELLYPNHDPYARGLEEGWGMQERIYDEPDDFGIGMRFQGRMHYEAHPRPDQVMYDEAYPRPAMDFEAIHNQAPVRRPEAEWRYAKRMRDQALVQLEGQYGFRPHMHGGAHPRGLNEGVEFPPAPQPASVPEQVLIPRPELEQDIFATLENMFPGICPDFVFTLFKTIQTSEQLVEHILNLPSYPRAKETQEKLKRKRDIDPDVEAARKYSSPDRIIPGIPNGTRPYIRTILGSEFPWVAFEDIERTLKNCGYRLFVAYQVLLESIRTYKPHPAPQTYKRLKGARKYDHSFSEAAVEAYLANPNGDLERIDVLTELQTVRRIRIKEEARRQERQQEELLTQREEEDNTRQAEAEGAMGECGCCFGDYPLNRMVHCNGEAQHDFCRQCARLNAETEVGNSKYELTCMSFDKCTADFDPDQRSQFLDEKIQLALDRLEKEAMLQILDNVARCPFCPFAAEYPPVDEDREFRCLNPECEKVTCRLCEKESHLPKSCDEMKKDENLSVRRIVEEAMSAALIRRCNKCNTPFIKEEGCNKMTCSKPNCTNIQCYICSKSCDYSHFNDRARGGKTGNCPLFDNVEDRHEVDVSNAQKEATAKILREHPEIDENDIVIHMSERVKQDEQRRKVNNRDVRRVLHGHDPLHIGHRLNIRPIRRPEPQIHPPPLYQPPPPFLPDIFDEFVEFADFDDGIY